MQKRKTISVAIIIICWLLSPELQAQGLKPTGSSLAPAPEASALNKFIDIPVSYYTGTPNIGAPIFNLSMQELSLPISLNYHASGLKVAEPASWVGAGWVLNAGGMINRNIRGLADEYVNGDLKGYFHNSTYYTAAGGLNITALLDCDQSSGISNYDALSGGLWDFEPDMFYFSMPGGSGKFTFDHNRNPVRMHADDIDIMAHPFQGTPNFNNYPTVNDYLWSIRTPDGTTYTFEAADKHTTSNSCEPSTNVQERQNAWHLVEMQKGDDVISFEYTLERIAYETTYSESKQFRVISVNTDGMPSGGQSSSSSDPCLINNTVLSQRLSRITSNNGYEVLFNVETDTAYDRSDLDGSFALDEIVIRKNGQLVKQVRLNHEYFGNDVKLKLNSIDQLADDGSGEYIRLYDFTYYENQSFPTLISTMQDFWGYYNGASLNGPSMLPEWKDANYHFNSNTSVSRKQDLDFTRIGTLKKMTLPTGGSQSFDYELHDFSADTFLQTYEYELSADSGTFSSPVVDVVEFYVAQQNSISFVELSPFIDGMDASYTLEKKTDSSWVSALPLQKRPGYLAKVGATDVYGHRNLIDSGEYRFTAKSEGSYIHMKLVLDQLEPVKFERIGGLRIREITTYEPESDESLHKLFEYTTGEGLNKKSSGVVFTTPDFGGYFTEDNWHDSALEYTIGDPEQSIDMTFLTVVDVEIVEPTQENQKRFKKTTQSYVTETITFGNGVDAAESCRENTLTVYLNLSASPQIHMGTSNGSHVGYSEVKTYDMRTEDRLTVIRGDGSYKPVNASYTDASKKLGYSAYYFTNFKPVQELEFPFNRPEDLSYKNGKLLKSEVFAKTSTGFKMLNQQINIYDEIPWVNREFTSGLIVKPRVFYECENCDEGALGFAMYFNNKNWHFQKSAISRTFENDTVITKSVNFYETEEPYLHFMANGSESVDSKGDTTNVDIFRHIGFPALVRKQEVFVNGVQVAGESVDYYGTLPSGYQSWNRDTDDYQDEISINYGQYGLVEESSAFVSTTDPVTTTFLWGYNHSNMIAAFTNVTDSELTALLSSVGVSRAWFNNFSNKANYKTKLLGIQALLSNTQQMQISLFDKPYGPTEMIDVNGNSIYYIYDKFGRLKQVKDKDLFVLQEYELKYHNQ